MSQANTIETKINFDTDHIIKEGIDYLQTALATFGGPEGKAAAIAIEGIEMLFDGELEKLFDEGLDEIPQITERLSNGLISERSAKQVMYQLLKNETVMKIIDAIIKGVSDLIANYIIEPMKKGIDLTSEKLQEFLGGLGSFGAQLKEVVGQIDQCIDNVLSGLQNNVQNAYKSVNASANDFVVKFENERNGLKNNISSEAIAVIEKRANALESAAQASKEISKSQSIDPQLIDQAAKIMNTHGIQSSEKGIEAINAKAPEQKQETKVQEQSRSM